ncbi:MAG: ATP-NAD kinase family protein [Candidatus Thermoplasmatota archaeon]|jgi:predicted polyphosphate/ATP-dependent NAD kinase|nr:ATP-NAD kinase family protein [Candidatus Thermoplasmatota archaeon]
MEMVLKIGFVVNPIAGMGGRVGLKGTDGVLDKAVSLGAKPVAPGKAEETLKEFLSKYSTEKDVVCWFTCSGSMGFDELKNVGMKNVEVVYSSAGVNTTSTDTKKACEVFLEKNVDLVVFCGGDGTMRDIFSVVDKKVPVLGIPAGVKMHSGVFGVNTRAVAKMLHEFINKNLTIGDVDVMDLDEELYRKGEWKIKLFGVAKGIVEPTYVQVGKTVFESVSDDEVKDELAEHVLDEMNKYRDHLFLMGSGGTIDYIARKIGLDNTLLGIDAVYDKKTVAKDLNEKGILDLLGRYPKAKVVLSPIGAQGFILGRGNLQLSPRVIQKIGLDNIIVVSTPSKLVSTPFIRVDTGDKVLDRIFAEKEFMMVVIGYRLSRVVHIQTNNF